MPNPTNQINSLTSGDSANFFIDRTCGDYAPPDWEAQFIIGTDTPTPFDAITTGGRFNVLITADQSEALVSGVYLCNVVFTNPTTSERKTISQPYFIVFPNPLVTATPGWEKTTLAAVQVALTTLAGSPNSQVSVNGQTFTKQSITALLAFRDRLLAEIAYKDAQLGLPAPGQSRTIKTIFRD